jgi:hypothetical protein
MSCGTIAPKGLRLQDTGDQLTLVSAPACTAAIERYLRKPPPEALSRAALEVLAIVAYEQPVMRADIRAIRGVDSDAVVETRMARRLIAEDPPLRRPRSPRFSHHGRRVLATLRTEFARCPSASATTATGEVDAMLSWPFPGT